MQMTDIDLIALAGLLHDIGKFGQRAQIDIDEYDLQRYCPRDKHGNPTHKHAAYTAKILGDLIVEKQKSDHRIVPAKSLNDNFITISAKHHIPETDEEWIVACADRLASGFERESFKEYNKRVEEEVRTSYKEQKLDHIFVKNAKFPLSPLLSDNIFATDENDESGYRKLWEEFESGLKKLDGKLPKHIKIQALEFLLKKYTSFMPSSTSFRYKDYEIIKPNVPLYEHLKTTSIFASAIASMSDENRSKVLAYYKEKKDTLDEKVFLLIAGDFFGIQEFIFNEVQTKFAAKTLRAKSAYIQILTKVLSFYVCKELGLSKYAIISTHAGKFEILAPNEKAIIDKLETIQKELNEYFIDHFFGQTGVGITYEKASIGDFILKDHYKDLRKRLGDKIEEIKYKKFDLFTRGYKIFEIEEGLNNQNLCDFCHKRKGKGEEYKICSECEKYVKIGEKLTKNRFLTIRTKRKESGDIEIFEGYYLHFFDNVSKELTKEDIAIYDISNDEEFRGLEKWELASYVYLKDGRELATFEDIAKQSVKEGIKEEGKREYGVEAIMALKGDVDGMSDFIKNSDVTDSFAKYNFFAKMMDYYFSVYVPVKLMQHKPLYTVFAGGDDLFVLGAWDETIEFGKNVREDFIKFTGGRLTFSAGMIMSKANKPVNFIAQSVEEALEDAKDYCCVKKHHICKEVIEGNGNSEHELAKVVQDKEDFCENSDVIKKDALSLFTETSRWDSYIDTRSNLLPSLQTKNLKTAFLYRLIEIADMSKKVGFAGDIHSTIWKSKLNYTYTRNVDPSNTQLLHLLSDVIEKFPKEFKMVLFEYLYTRRKS